MNSSTTQPLNRSTHTFNPSIFREYDIRGTYGQNLNDADAYQIGLNYAATIKNGKVAVGFDGRLSSPALCASLINGLTDGGLDVINVGLVPTPALYFAVFELNLDGGIMITGSHNPPDQNGFKIMVGKDSLYGADIKKLKKLQATRHKAQGTVQKVDIKKDYIKKILQLEPCNLQLNIGWDPANGAAGEIIEIISGGKFAINTKIDGTFPAHPADPAEEKNLSQLKDLVLQNKLDVGFAFDGDGDRVGVIDEQARAIAGDQILGILANSVLAKHKGASIVVDVKTSKAVTDHIKKLGGVPVMYKCGHSLIKAKMKELGSPLAGEMSAHIFIADGYYGFDDGIYAAIRFLQVMQETGKSAGQLFDELPKMISSHEYKIAVPDDKKFALIEEIKSAITSAHPALDAGSCKDSALNAECEVITIDGVRVQHDFGWWLVRASNTGGNIICRFEADTTQNYAKISGELNSYLAKIGLSIKL